jgi:hypothetical protein
MIFIHFEKSCLMQFSPSNPHSVLEMADFFLRTEARPLSS